MVKVCEDSHTFKARLAECWSHSLNETRAMSLRIRQLSVMLDLI